MNRHAWRYTKHAGAVVEGTDSASDVRAMPVRVALLAVVLEVDVFDDIEISVVYARVHDIDVDVRRCSARHAPPVAGANKVDTPRYDLVRV